MGIYYNLIKSWTLILIDVSDNLSVEAQNQVNCKQNHFQKFKIQIKFQIKFIITTIHFDLIKI